MHLGVSWRAEEIHVSHSTCCTRHRLWFNSDPFLASRFVPFVTGANWGEEERVENPSSQRS